MADEIKERSVEVQCDCGRTIQAERRVYSNGSWDQWVKCPSDCATDDQGDQLEDDYRNTGHWAMGQHHLRP